LFSKEGAKPVRDIIGYISAYKPVYDDKEFYNTPDEFFAGQPLLKTFADLAFKVQARPLNQYDNVINDAVTLGLKGLTSGLSSDDAVKAVIEEVKRKATDLTE